MNANADHVISINNAVPILKSGSLTDKEILAEFSSDQEVMVDNKDIDEIEVIEIHCK